MPREPVTCETTLFLEWYLVLYVTHTEFEDAGVYECESKNDVGLQLRSIKLDVKG